MIPDIVHYNQNAYVKGKSIFDAVRTIDDILEFTEREKIQGLMVAIDFKSKDRLPITLSLQLMKSKGTLERTSQMARMEPYRPRQPPLSKRFLMVSRS